MRRTIRWLAWTLLLLLLLAAAGLWAFLRHGISARDRPTIVEVALARRLRHLAIPSDARARTNPTPDTPETIAAGLAHFADHCATCHANNGSGDTELGRNLYPKAPDMRLAETQDLSDGELFYIIENGVRLTGMPAWGTGSNSADAAHDTWALVRFIRHLPKLTEAELQQMQALNPKSPDEFREEEENRRFLAGEDQPDEEKKPSPPQPEHHHHH